MDAHLTIKSSINSASASTFIRFVDLHHNIKSKIALGSQEIQTNIAHGINAKARCLYIITNQQEFLLCENI